MRKILLCLGVAMFLIVFMVDSANSSSLISLSEKTTAVQALSSSDRSNLSGAQRTVVILVEFNNTVHAKSPEEIYAMMRQSDAYWKEVSYDRINIDWYGRTR